MSTKFELAIVLLIAFNMVVMAVEHYNQTESITDALKILNVIFTSVFVLEAIVKLLGLRWHYFRVPWNIFDFIIVLLSLIGEWLIRCYIASVTKSKKILRYFFNRLFISLNVYLQDHNKFLMAFYIQRIHLL
jgi:hypothetical protein